MERQRLKDLAAKTATTTAQILQSPLGSIRMTYPDDYTYFVSFTRKFLNATGP